MKILLGFLLSIPAFAACTQATISDAFVAYLIGPQCLVGTGSPGAARVWRDSQASYDSSVQATNSTYPTGDMWAPYKHLSAGNTISIGAGQFTATRATGSIDLRDACGGGSSPLTNANVIFEFTGTDANTYYQYINIVSCDSATQVTLLHAWTPGSPSVAPASLTGVNFRLDWYTGATAWIGQSGTPNYDGQVMGEYNLHYRTSGDTAHLALANANADIWWNTPEMQRGYCATMIAGAGTCWTVKGQSLQGMFLRATLGGDATYWPGLRRFRDQQSTVVNPPEHYIYDQRDSAYIQLSLAAGCKGDPTPAEQTTWCNALVDMNTNQWAPVYAARSNFMASYYCGPASFAITSCNANISSHVEFTSGSPTVTLVGTTWTNDYKFGVLGAGPNMMLFATPNTMPLDNTSGADNVIYCQYVDSTHCTKVNNAGTPVNFSTTDNNRGWTLLDNGTGHALGYGTQPFFMALMIDSWEQSALALDAFGNTTVRDIYRGYANTGIQWLLDYSQNTTAGGYYFQQTANCPQNTTRSDCTNGAPYELLAWNLELARPMAQNYGRTGNASIPAFVEGALDEMFANATGPVMGTCTALPYIYTYDQTCIGLGGGDWVTINTGGLNGHKFFGQLIGINGWDWYAATAPAVDSNATKISGVLKIAGPAVIR